MRLPNNIGHVAITSDTPCDSFLSIKKTCKCAMFVVRADNPNKTFSPQNEAGSSFHSRANEWNEKSVSQESHQRSFLIDAISFMNIQMIESKSSIFLNLVSVKKYVKRRKPLNQLSRDLFSIDHYEISVVMKKELLYSLLYEISGY